MGDVFLSTERELFVQREPYRDCELCQGVGTVSAPCYFCDQQGQCRAQIVITVANIDTGLASSLNIVPGVLEPVQLPNGRYAADLTPLIQRVARQVEAETIFTAWSADTPQLFSTDLSRYVFFPDGWRPDAPKEERLALEAVGIIRAAKFPGWELYFGRSTAKPDEDPDQTLLRLCALANRLCVDFVIEVQPGNSGGWKLRYDVPRTSYIADIAPYLSSLEGALSASSPHELFRRINMRGINTPAHWIHESQQERDAAPISVTELSKRMLALCESGPGAIAIWRDAQWHLTSLIESEQKEIVTEQDTGQVLIEHIPVHAMSLMPPPPSYLGSEIPQRPCGNCASGPVWRRCHCLLESGTVEVNCGTCHGAGVCISDLCNSCFGNRQIRYGAVITLTDFAGVVKHINWKSANVAAEVVDIAPNGSPEVQLPCEYRLSNLARAAGINPADLVDLNDGTNVDFRLADGFIFSHGSGRRLINDYLVQVSKGRPAARIFIGIDQKPNIEIDCLVRIGLTLGFTIEVATQSHKHNAGIYPTRVQGERWELTYVRGEDPISPYPPLRHSLHLATSRLSHRLNSAIHEAMAPSLAQPLPIPQVVQPVSCDMEDLEETLRRIAEHHSGMVICARLKAQQCDIYLGEPGEMEHIARASTLREAANALLGPNTM